MLSQQVNLHQHTEGSFLDGEARPETIFKRAAELGQQFVTFTDHGECNQHLVGAKLAAKHGIGFIPGMEGYLITSGELAAAREEKRYPQHSHICLLAADNEGLSNLWALSSMAYTEDFFYHKPNATYELLREYAGGLYGSDGCLMTDFAKAAVADREDECRQIYGELADIFKERFYVELHTWQFMDPQTDEELDLNAQMTKVNQVKYRLATEMGLPFVVVNDAHHAYPEQWENRELVWRFNTGKNRDILSEERRQKADHLMGAEELYGWMDRHGIPAAAVDQAIAYSWEIANNCKVEIKPTLKMPRIAASEAEDLSDLIDHCEKGFREKVLDQGLDAEKYYARLEDELKLIAEKNFAGYFNMVRDYTMAYRTGSWSQYVKAGAPKDPQLLGPGRGSVGGSLVAYLLGIDIIDPIKYGTLFSRFLSPGRKGLPDVDVDVPQSQRQEMLKYLPARFGHDNVCIIGTLNRNGPKATLRDLGRAMDIPYADINIISEHIAELEVLKGLDLNPDGGGDELTWAEVVERRADKLRPYAVKHPRLFEKMNEMSGLIRHSSVHAAGILVVDKSTPLKGAVPLRRTKNKVITTQFDMWEVEELGGVKLDLLGIRHLDTLSAARKLIYERHGVWIDYDASGLSVPEGCTNVLSFGDEHFTDPVIWPAIHEGRTTGVFQVETPNCTDCAIDLKPISERDVAHLSSIVRPGVADAGLKDTYLRRRAGLEPVVYDHPLMEPITGPHSDMPTFGVLVYQEQLIRVVEDIAGFTPDESDDLRKNVGKKLMDKLIKLKEKFVEGCLANPNFTLGQDAAARKAAHKIWDSIEASGRYAFNWSHAVGYAMISTWEIWTKHYYPQEFVVALMQTDSDNINRYLREARRDNIEILPPDINKSEQKFTIEGTAIRYGIDTVRGVGSAVCKDIIKARPYTSFQDYLARAGRGASKGAAINLISIGAFDEMAKGMAADSFKQAVCRTQFLEALERHRVLEKVAPTKLAKLTEEERDEIWREKVLKYPDTYAIPIPDFTNEKVVYGIEKELVGTYVTVDPMGRYVPMLKSPDVRAIDSPFDMMRYEKGALFVIGGQVTAIKHTKTKARQEDMAIITVEWNETDFRIAVFPEAWRRTKEMLKVGAPVACEVKRLDSGCCLERVERLDYLLSMSEAL